MPRSADWTCVPITTILDRRTLEEIGHIGRAGRKAGEFFHLHSLGVDPKGNIVTGESQGYRVQKFIYKGLRPVPSKDQGVIWPR